MVGKVSLSTLSSERAFVPVTKDPVESSITSLACGSSDVFTLISKLVDRSALSNRPEEVNVSDGSGLVFSREAARLISDTDADVYSSEVEISCCLSCTQLLVTAC